MEVRSWWLDRFSIRDIVEMAECAWGPREFWDETWRDGYVFT